MRPVAALLLALHLAALSPGGERFEAFDRDPGWEGRNNRSTAFEPRPVVQDFGWSPTRHAGGLAAGEVGGLITPAAEAAWYGRRIPAATLESHLEASGVLSVGEGPVHVLIGFFNAGTLNEWRTPNTLALRIQGRGDVFFAYLEYATSRWRAGGDAPRPFPQRRDVLTGRDSPLEFEAHGARHTWSIRYDPAGNDGRGVLTATIDGATAVCELAPGHKDDGATFDHFGLMTVMKSADTAGTLWLDDVRILGELAPFEVDPRWDEAGNRRRILSTQVRPRFDFGYSKTNHAGGDMPGELGGLVFRGDCREAARLASYGDRVGPFTLDRPLRASGKIVLTRGVSDSTSLFGFYHSEASLRVHDAQDSGFPDSFLGFAVEGPSREGFFAYPVAVAAAGAGAYADGDDRPRILPDGQPHRWSVEYDPTALEGRGRLTLTFDDRVTSVALPPGAREAGASFDRFGIVTTWIDGNAQTIFFDDLRYDATR